VSARFTVYCDQGGAYGCCPARLYTEERTEDAAYATAEAAGWDIHGTPDYCPTHSRRPDRHTPALATLRPASEENDDAQH
jgi:hypothetical protein